ncbi:hypothetical protein [Nocardia phage NS-I]|nr:hypothetical protein [Nocardia phage NS-I]
MAELAPSYNRLKTATCNARCVTVRSGFNGTRYNLARL